LAFSDEADFSGISEEAFENFPRSSTRRSWSVNEEGTESGSSQCVLMVKIGARWSGSGAKNLQGRPSVPLLHQGQENQRRVVLSRLVDPT